MCVVLVYAGKLGVRAQICKGDVRCADGSERELNKFIELTENLVLKLTFLNFAHSKYSFNSSLRQFTL